MAPGDRAESRAAAPPDPPRDTRPEADDAPAVQGDNAGPAEGNAPRTDPESAALWPADLTVLIGILLGLALPEEVTIGAWWLVPSAETLLLLGLVASSPRRPSQIDRRRRIRIGLVGLVSGINVVVLLLLAERLVQRAGLDGRSLLVGAGALWLIAVLLFAVWFWELDRGGAVARAYQEEDPVDFLFPQMTEPGAAPPGWRPEFLDYLYLSLTNAASFGPGETTPLTRRAKVLMGLQALASLMTMTIVLAYAINNLG
ncbi:hypothetical protein ACVGVM_18930 [Pseudonocardia bannensis]|uniref:DUF1345 domain-containing protein n=1 Tax=Pseudonocardia bannensis TaxID=630973 RepID=A0A848DIU4_9PSEU|nr:hypothetical protein [Pseudonocardia bannensis]NMH92411.1 hypothetical protein [Pseudonocardia bannensis]